MLSHWIKEVLQDPQKQHPTRAREDLGILELPSLPDCGSEGGEVPSELNLDPPGWSDFPILAANTALTWHWGTCRKLQCPKPSISPAAPLRLSPLLGPETHLPRQLLAVLRYLPFLWLPPRRPWVGYPPLFTLAQFLLLWIWLGFWISVLGFIPRRNWLHVSSCKRCSLEVPVDSKGPEDLLRTKLKGGLSYLRAD